MKKRIKIFSLILISAVFLSSCSTSERARQTTTSSDYWDIIMNAYEEEMKTVYDAYEEQPVTEDPFAGMSDDEKIKSWQEAHGNYVEDESETASSYSPVIKNATGFYDGIAILEIDITGNDDTGFYAYNYYDKTFTLLNINEMPVDFSGTTAIMKNESIISLTSGEIIMSPDKDYTRLIECNTTYRSNDTGSYFVYSNDYDYYFGDYLIAYNVKESFDGNVYSLGVINNNGEWVVQMSSDLTIFDTVNFSTSTSDFDYMGNGVVEIGDYAYSFLDDVVICETGGYGSFATQNTIFARGKYGIGFYTYNKSTKEWTEYEHDVEWVSDEGMLIEKYDNERKKYANLILDHDFNVIHDLSDYELKGETSEGALQFTNTMAAFTAEGASGDTYFCIIDKNSEFDFEPIKAEYGEENYLLEENRIFMYFDNHAIIDFNTGSKKNIKAFRENATLYTPSYDPKTDTFLCKVDVPLEYFGTTPSYYFIHSDGTEIFESPIQIN